MRELLFFENADAGVLAKANGCGCPFANAVNGQDGGPVKGRGIKGAGSVRKMMLRKKHLGRAGAELGYGLAQHGAHEQLFLDPDGNGRKKAAQASRGKAVVGFKQALELEVGLVVKSHSLQIGNIQAALAQHIGRSVAGKSGIVLDARKALFVSGCHNFAVHQQHGCGVVIIGRNAKNGSGHEGSHMSLALGAPDPILLKNRVNKGRYGRAAGHHHKHAKQQQNEHKGKQPEFFALHKKLQQVFKKIH